VLNFAKIGGFGALVSGAEGQSGDDKKLERKLDRISRIKQPFIPLMRFLIHFGRVCGDFLLCHRSRRRMRSR
jgi:hypothetical protein